jgi:hypothetical protein
MSLNLGSSVKKPLIFILLFLPVSQIPVLSLELSAEIPSARTCLSGCHDTCHTFTKHVKTSRRRTGFDARQVNVGFVVGKAALGQVFLRVLPFSPPVGIIPPLLRNNILPTNHPQNAVLANFTASLRTINIKP